MSRLVAILAGILAFVLSPPSMAHHGGFYEAMGKAIETQDLESVRDRFTASAWKSEGEGLDGVSLHRRLAAAEAVDADGVLEYSRDERCLVAVRFYEKGVDEPRIHWLAGAKVLPGREPEARPWRVVRILSEVKEAREYLRNPRIRSHIEGPPLDAADAEIARRARAVLGREEAAQEVCAEGAWDRTDELSIRGFREKPPEKGKD